MTQTALDLRWVLTRGRATLVPTGMRSILRASVVRSRYRGLSPDDLLLAGFPKSGSTWLRFVMLQLTTGKAPNSFADVDSVSPDVGAHKTAPRVVEGVGRLLKTHERFRRAGAETLRSVCIVRDPRDVAISLFHYLERRHADHVDFDEFIEAFVGGQVLPYGAWDEHVESWYDAQRLYPNRVSVLRYEDLLANGADTLTAGLKRLGFGFTAAEIAAALDDNSADAMRRKEKSTPSSNFREGRNGELTVPFVRAAVAGQWRAVMTRAQAGRFESAFSATLARAGYEPRET